MKKNLFHSIGLLFALLGFLFFRLWPSTPPLSVAQDEYLQRVAAEQPKAAPAPAPVPVPVAVAPKPLAPPTVVPPPPAPVAVPDAVIAPEPKPTPPATAARVRQEVPKPAAVIASTPKSEPKPVPVSPKPKPQKPDPATAATLKKIGTFAATHGMTPATSGQGVNAQFQRKDVVPGQKTGGVNDIYQSQTSALDAFEKKVEK